MNKSEANMHGKALIEKLEQGGLKGFKLRVWENMGWHYSADGCRIYIYASTTKCGEPQQYNALAGGNRSGIMEWTTNFTDSDPVKVYCNAVEVAENHVKDLLGILYGIKSHSEK